MNELHLLQYKWAEFQRTKQRPWCLMEGAIEGRQYSSSCLCVYASSPPASSIPMIYYAPVEATGLWTWVRSNYPTWPELTQKVGKSLWQNKRFPENLNSCCFSVGLSSIYALPIIIMTSCGKWSRADVAASFASFPLNPGWLRIERWYGNFNVRCCRAGLLYMPVQHQKIGNWRVTRSHWTPLTYSEVVGKYLYNKSQTRM